MFDFVLRSLGCVSYFALFCGCLFIKFERCCFAMWLTRVGTFFVVFYVINFVDDVLLLGIDCGYVGFSFCECG